MEKPIACFDISSDSIKLLIGYVLGGKPIVLYKAEKKIPGVIVGGKVMDRAGLGTALGEFRTISDETAKLKINIGEICLVLPPYGLHIYQTEKTTNVVSPSNEIAKIDISNVVSLVKKEAIPGGNAIVDIVPDEFILDDGTRTQEPPLGKRSTSLTIKAKIHTLPEVSASLFPGIANQAGYRVKKSSVATYCYGKLFGCYDDLPESYILVDMGGENTTVSIIGEKMPYASTFFPKGGNELTTAIESAFNIDNAEAEKFKCQRGYDERKISFDPPLVSRVGENGLEEEYFQKDLNAVIASFYEEYLGSLDNAIKTLVAPYRGQLDSLPILVTGGASRLNGLADLLKKQFASRPILFPVPRAIGARDPRYAACLGLLVSSSKYAGSLEDNYHGIATVSRVAPKKEKRKEADYGDDAL